DAKRQAVPTDPSRSRPLSGLVAAPALGREFKGAGDQALANLTWLVSTESLSRSPSPSVTIHLNWSRMQAARELNGGDARSYFVSYFTHWGIKPQSLSPASPSPEVGQVG